METGTGTHVFISQKQAATFNKVITNVLDIVSKAREEWESEAGSRGGAGQTSSLTDTHTLVAAVGMGKGLKMMMPQPGAPVGPGMMVAPGGPGRAGGPGPGQMPMGPSGQPSKYSQTDVLISIVLTVNWSMVFSV